MVSVECIAREAGALGNVTARIAFNRIRNLSYKASRFEWNVECELYLETGRRINAALITSLQSEEIRFESVFSNFKFKIPPFWSSVIHIPENFDITKIPLGDAKYITKAFLDAFNLENEKNIKSMKKRRKTLFVKIKARKFKK